VSDLVLAADLHPAVVHEERSHRARRLWSASNDRGRHLEEAGIALVRDSMGLFDRSVMDGLTATREIRALEAREGRPRTPVVMLTANALAEHVAAAQAAGADRHLAKPFDAAELIETVQQLPEQARQAA
jgi:CheY-like chemotaxis protein